MAKKLKILRLTDEEGQRLLRIVRRLGSYGAGAETDRRPACPRAHQGVPSGGRSDRGRRPPGHNHRHTPGGSATRGRTL